MEKTASEFVIFAKNCEDDQMKEGYVVCKEENGNAYKVLVEP
jgi:hypothetical protein